MSQIPCSAYIFGILTKVKG